MFSAILPIEDWEETGRGACLALGAPLPVKVEIKVEPILRSVSAEVTR